MESPCKGGLDVSEKALLSMLGSSKFVKKPVVSDSERKIYDILAVIEDSENNLDVAASRLGLTKSSLKRMVSTSNSYAAAYDERNPLGRSRKYLERTMGKWTVATLDPATGAACLNMNNGKTTVRLSVTAPISRT